MPPTGSSSSVSSTLAGNLSDEAGSDSSVRMCYCDVSQYFEMKHFKTIVCTVFCLLLTDSAKAGEFTIMPGHSVGRVWLGAPHATVRRIWGRPYLIQRAGPYAIEGWRTDKKNLNSSTSAVFKRGRVVQLETDSPRFVTPHGVSIRSNLGYIRRVFGKMRQLSFGRNDPDPEVANHAANYLDAVRRGVAFELDLGLSANPAAGFVPHAIIVHRSAHRFIHVYGEQVWAADQ